MSDGVQPIWKEWTDRKSGMKYYFKGPNVSWVKPARFIPEKELVPFVQECDKITAGLERLQTEAYEMSEAHRSGRRKVNLKMMRGLSAEITNLLLDLDNAPIPKFQPNLHEEELFSDPDSRQRRKKLIKFAEDLDKQIKSMLASLEQHG